MLARRLTAMSNRSLAAVHRTRVIAQHMQASTQAGPAKPDGNAEEPPVLFESVGQIRQFILNRPKKLNALDTTMLNLLRPYVEDWSRSTMSKVLVGTGVGRAFCAGGDVAGVVLDAENEETRPRAVDFFKREFELDYLLAAVPHPYVAVMDGITMGGGVGLSVNASFRIATENTVFAMPETKIGYCPDVGASFFLSRLDGELGTYLGLTGESIKGRDVYELGLATHYVPSRRIQGLLERIASFDRASFEAIDNTIEECSLERDPTEPPCIFSGTKRVVLDAVFGHNTVEEIFADLKQVSEEHQDADIRTWAQATLSTLEERSPTSLKVTLEALRKGRGSSLHSALQTELNIATAYCHGASRDFDTGVRHVIIEKIKEGRPAWSPSTLSETNTADIKAKFFSQYSPENGTAPELTVPAGANIEVEKTGAPMRFALPTEAEIQQLVQGSHKSSGSSAITLNDLVKKLEVLRKGKMGVREKALDVVKRKCVEEEDKQSGQKYLKWVP